MHVLPNLVVREKSYIYKTYLPHKTDTVGLCGLRRLPPVFWFEKKGETMFWTALVCHICLQNILIGCAFITCKHARLNMAINKKTQPNSFVFSSLMGHTQKDLGRWHVSGIQSWRSTSSSSLWLPVWSLFSSYRVLPFNVTTCSKDSFLSTLWTLELGGIFFIPDWNHYLLILALSIFD